MIEQSLEFQTPFSMLDVRNCRLKKQRIKDVYGLVLMARGYVIELFIESVEDRDKWISALKKHVILLDLDDELIIGEILGKGNFAEVNLCVRNSDINKEFALKTLRKSAILESPRNNNFLIAEIDVLRSLDHPNIISLEETYETEKGIHLLL